MKLYLISQNRFANIIFSANMGLYYKIAERSINMNYIRHNMEDVF